MYHSVPTIMPVSNTTVSQPLVFTAPPVIVPPPPQIVLKPALAPVIIPFVSAPPIVMPITDAYNDVAITSKPSLPIDGGILPNNTFAGLLSQPFFATSSSVVESTSQWATFPAVTNLDMNTFGIENTSLVSVIDPTNDSNLQINSNTVMFFTDNVLKANIALDGDTLLLHNTMGGINIVDDNIILDFPTTAPSFILPLDDTQSASLIFTDTVGTHNLRAIDGDLFFDDELLARAADIQDITDWSLYPALENVNFDGQAILSAGSVGISNVTLTADVFNNLLVDGNIVALASGVPVAVADWSTYNATTAVNLNGNALQLAENVSILSAGAVMVTLTSNDLGNLLKDEVPVALITDINTNQWSTFPAVASINCDGNTITNCDSLRLPNVTLSSDLTGLLVDGQPVSADWSRYQATQTVNFQLNDLQFVGDVDCRNLNVGESGSSLGDLNLYGSNNLIGDNALFVEGGVSMSANGNVHAIHLGTNTNLGIDLCRIDLTPVGVITMISPAGITIDAGGAINVAAGGAVSIAGGSYVEMNSGEIRIVNSSTSANAKIVFPEPDGSIEFNGGGEITGLAGGQIAFITDIPRTYGSFSSDLTQVVSGIDLPTKIEYNATDVGAGIVLNAGGIELPVAGDYKIITTLQLDSSGSSTNFWLELDGVIVANTGNQSTANTVTLSAIVSATIGQILQVMFASADGSRSVVATGAQTVPYNFPAIPSIKTIVQLL